MSGVLEKLDFPAPKYIIYNMGSPKKKKFILTVSRDVACIGENKYPTEYIIMNCDGLTFQRSGVLQGIINIQIYII